MSGVSLLSLISFVWRYRCRGRAEAQRRAADESRKALQSAIEQCTLPVLVQPEKLPAGWAVAPEIYYPPHTAVIPLLLPSETEAMSRFRTHDSSTKSNARRSMGLTGGSLASAFLLCCHTGCVRPSQMSEVDFLKQLVHHEGLLSELATSSGATLVELSHFRSGLCQEREGDGAVNGSALTTMCPFSHALTTTQDCTTLLGYNGAFLIAAVFLGFDADLEKPTALVSDSLTTAAPSLVHSTCGTAKPLKLHEAVEAVLKSVVAVPLRAGKTGSKLYPPASPQITQSGHYRVMCSRGGVKLEMVVPVDFTVRFSSFPATATAVESSVTSRNSEVVKGMVSLAFPDTVVSPGVQLDLTEDVFAAMVAASSLTPLLTSIDLKLTGASALDAIKGIRLQVLHTSHSVTDEVTVVFTQPQIGVAFSLHSAMGKVYEPCMMSNAAIIYYPIGEEACTNGEDPPVMTIEYLPYCPAPWESVLQDDDELIHNVLLHFSNWEVAPVTGAMSDVSGLRSVVFHETQGGRRSRTYVLPRGDSLLMVRWDTSEKNWDDHVAVFQQVLDTLHVDDTLTK